MKKIIKSYMVIFRFPQIECNNIMKMMGMLHACLRTLYLLVFAGPIKFKTTKKAVNWDSRISFV